MTTKPTIDRHVNKDILLCKTANRRTSRCTCDKLMQDAIPFSMRWKKVPFFKRSHFAGAEKVCEISINRNEYTKARQSLDCLEEIYRKRLQLNFL